MKLNLDSLALDHAENTGSTRADAKADIQAVFALIAENMAAGHELSIPGFGKFVGQAKAARKARNPATGAIVDVPAKSIPKFTAAKHLKEAVNHECVY